MRLSYSQVSKYTQCGESYRLHYIAKIRPKFRKASLLFGDSLDKAFNSCLLKDGNPHEEFDKIWNESFAKSTDIIYANSDFDSDLLSDYDIGLLGDDWEAEYQTIKNNKKVIGFEFLKKEYKEFYNLANWLCLKQKGHIMINSYLEQVIPKITKVNAVQEYISLTNNVGDEITGYVDFIAELEGHGRVILDNKTSTIEYEKDSVLTSPQLSIYMHILEEKYQTRKAGFIVISKQISKNKTKICEKCGFDGSSTSHTTCNNTIDGKRCKGDYNVKMRPEARITIIVDEIPERTEQIVLENVDMATEGIKKGIFTRNMNMCDHFYGDKCPYKDLCFKNKMKGLEQK